MADNRVFANLWRGVAIRFSRSKLKNDEQLFLMACPERPTVLGFGLLRESALFLVKSRFHQSTPSG